MVLYRQAYLAALLNTPKVVRIFLIRAVDLINKSIRG